MALEVGSEWGRPPDKMRLADLYMGDFSHHQRQLKNTTPDRWVATTTAIAGWFVTPRMGF